MSPAKTVLKPKLRVTLNVLVKGIHVVSCSKVFILLFTFSVRFERRSTKDGSGLQNPVTGH